MQQKDFVGKIYNIIKYIMQSAGCHKNFIKNQLNACIKDELFNYAKFLFIKNRGV